MPKNSQSTRHRYTSFTSFGKWTNRIWKSPQKIFSCARYLFLLLNHTSLDNLLTDFARLASNSFDARPCFFGLWKEGKYNLETQAGFSDFEAFRNSLKTLWLDSSEEEKGRRFSGSISVQLEEGEQDLRYQAWKFELSDQNTKGLILFLDLPSGDNFPIEDQKFRPWLDFLINHLECYLSKTSENEAAVFKAVLDNSSELVVLIDPAHRVLEYNQFASHLLFEYFKVPIQKGLDYRDFVMPHIMELYLDGFQTAMRGDRFFVEHNTVSDTLSHWFEYYMFPVYNLGRELIGVCLRGRDITTEKTAELELKSLAETFNALNENLNESVVILSKDYKVLRFNSHASKRLEVNSGKVIKKGVDIREYLDFGVEEDFVEKFQQAINGNLIEIESAFSSLGGENIWAQTRFIPIFSEHKKILGVGLLVRNIHEQKMLQLELQESEEKFRKIVSSAAMAILIIDQKMRISTVNPEVSRIFGYTEQELIGQSIQMLIPAKYHQVHTRHQENYARAPRPMRMMEDRNTKALKKNGDEIDIEVSLNSFQLEKSTYYMAMILDVTEKNKLSRLLENATKLSLTGNWEQTIFQNGDKSLFWSPMTRQIFEVSNDYVPRFEDLKNLFEIQSYNILEESISKLVETGKGYDLELMIITPRGRKKWVRAIGTMEEVNGNGIKIYGTLQDIDQKKLNEIELVKSLQSVKNYKQALEKSSFVSVTGLDGIVLDVNDSWCHLTEYTREELIGASSNITKSDYHQESFFEELWDTIRSGNIWKGEIRDVSKNGNYFWVDTTIVPMKNENGDVYQYITIRNDVTEKKRAVEELEVRAKELARSNTELEQFAYVASHDLQEPLRMVTSFLTILKRKYSSQLDESAVRYIDFAVDGAFRMRSTILDLLEFSRVGKGEEEKQEIKIDRLVDEVLILQKKSIEESKARIEFENLPVLVSYKVQLIQVFGNLISNAIKYRKPDQNPLIQIRAVDLGTKWKFSISDNGIGFSMAYSEKVFVIFQRLHTRATYPGNGIGLAIVRKVLENLHGKIWVESEENVGTTFHFTIPK